ncbi:hypothetical protein [Lysobacter tyrosinilyticus]
MSASDAHKPHYKRREELDILLDGFERDLTMRVDALIDYCNGYADSILSVTADGDDPHVSSRINAILRQCSVTFNLPDADALDSTDSRESPKPRSQ